MRFRTYSELKRIDSFMDKYEYLRLNGQVGEKTFGFDRYINQQFYRSSQWKQIRQHVIARDQGCDMGHEDYEIHGRILIHHMNPMLPRDIVEGDDSILNPEYLISVTHNTHNAIHYGNESLLPQPLVERRPGDTKLW